MPERRWVEWVRVSVMWKWGKTAHRERAVGGRTELSANFKVKLMYILLAATDLGLLQSWSTSTKRAREQERERAREHENRERERERARARKIASRERLRK